MRTALLSVTAMLVLVACPKPAQQPPGGATPGGELQGGGDGPDAPPNDPCAGKELPPCPSECSAAPGELAGAACTPDGTKCGNNIGDGCECTAGTWNCAVHAPLGPGECNLVCR